VASSFLPHNDGVPKWFFPLAEPLKQISYA
jgi:hypothetical protein